jgi:biopolymer transport protein TolR
MHGRKKHLDFELNLVPFIDLLSVCICFLLITAVWLNIGSLNVKQAVGGQSVAETEKKPLVWVLLGDRGDLTLDVKSGGKLPAKMLKMKLVGQAGKVDLNGLATLLADMRTIEPNLRTALIHPKASSVYEDIVGLMDQFKKAGLADLGVVPL